MMCNILHSSGHRPSRPRSTLLGVTETDSLGSPPAFTRSQKRSMTMRLATITLLAAVGAAAGCGAARAQAAGSSDLADFYRGKQMRMVIRSGPGGGFDL